MKSDQRFKLAGFTFQETGPAHAIEDCFRYEPDARVIAVADGVTRFDYARGPKEESNRVRRTAAEFCSVAVEILTTDGGIEPAAAIRRVGIEANRRIGLINQAYGFTPGDDYILRDPYAAVGACGMLGPDGRWHFGYIGDSGLCLFDRAGQSTALTVDQLAGTRRAMDRLSHLSRLELYRFLRTQLRNRPEVLDSTGEACGYGVLNGDPRAECYWQTGVVQVRPDDVVVAYTDGAKQLIDRREFAAILRSFGNDLEAQRATGCCRELWLKLSKAVEFCADDATIIAVHLW